MIFRRQNRPDDISFLRDNDFVEYARQSSKANKKPYNLISYKPDSMSKSLIITLLPPTYDKAKATKKWNYYFWSKNSAYKQNFKYFLMKFLFLFILLNF